MQNNAKNTETKPTDTKPTDTSYFQKVEAYLDDLYDIRYNIIANELEYKLKDEHVYRPLDENSIYRTMQHDKVKISMNKLMILLRSDFVPRFNPFQEYFDGLPKWWTEDPDYIDELCFYIKAKNQSRFNHHFKKMLVRCIACALLDNVYNKQAFIIVHQKQNSGKSTFCRWLCPPALNDYIAEHIGTDKDSLISLCENFLINLDELATLNKAELNTLKSIFSRDRVKVRRPFERKSVVSPRRANFLGSTNHTEFLYDETGSVRWLCFEIEDIDWDYKRNIDIDQVWSQAYYHYKSGFAYELTAEEIIENERENKRHFIISQEMELIAKYFKPASLEEHHVFYTATEFVQVLSRIAKFNTRITTVSIGKALMALGFEKTSKYNGTFSIKGYFAYFTTAAFDALPELEKEMLTN